MKHVFVWLLLFTAVSTVQSQEQTAKLLQETARSLMQKGDYDNAVIILQRAKAQEPENIDILRDLSYANYLKRDFAKAIEVGKQLTDKPNADPQSFQILGMAYKAIASYKECAKLYRTALRKFPNSGVIYNEYAELFALENELEEAIIQWEKGIELDPGYSSNYYNATMYYMRKSNWIRAALYGELFLNLESYSTRTEEIKPQLLTAYTRLFATGGIPQLNNAKTTSGFEKEILTVFTNTAGSGKPTAIIDDLIGIRTRFIQAWVPDKQKTTPFHLFAHQQYLLNQGLFNAYHYWLFSNTENYQAWQKNHAKESEAFTAFQQSRVFKVPTGEYYFSK